MDDYCYAKMATSAKREHERESAPPTSSKSPTEIKTKDEDFRHHPEGLPLQLQGGSCTLKPEASQSRLLKEEEEELCITKEGECFLLQEKVDPTKLPLTIVYVKTEDDEEKVNNLIAPLSDSEAEDKDEGTLCDTDCEDDIRTHTDNKHSQCIKKKTCQNTSSCIVCGMICTTKSRLTEHMRKHTGEKPFKCSVCCKSFSYNGSLAHHMRTHAEEKIFNCSVCGTNFSHKISLTQHMRTHTGERPFNCSICCKSFSVRSNLTQHMRTHTGEKLFNCPVCGKSFSQKSSVAVHMKTHSGERPFSCSACGKHFSNRQCLSRHEIRHTGEKPFSCSVCGNSFTERRNLLRHLRTRRRKHI
ncbi:oocyte zinc finger protein XlCOF6.1-like [Entelurus aequoreus]|uniref:oocyte zinc finger protein XlCOF6.1-like n=1 Tax=Entelurus aequoreus TaxID=161455 RepID=UPI002B1DD3E1|nr:oocyte zinc finger protein XlCOF6.1-like [Entelurus aequoreus]